MNADCEHCREWEICPFHPKEQTLEPGDALLRENAGERYETGDSFRREALAFTGGARDDLPDPVPAREIDNSVSIGGLSWPEPMFTGVSVCRDADSLTSGYMLVTVRDGTDVATKLKAMFLADSLANWSRMTLAAPAAGLRTEWAWFVKREEHPAGGLVTYVLRFFRDKGYRDLGPDGLRLIASGP
jgi:hypothetical protein